MHLQAGTGCGKARCLGKSTGDSELLMHPRFDKPFSGLPLLCTRKPTPGVAKQGALARAMATRSCLCTPGSASLISGALLCPRGASQGAIWHPTWTRQSDPNLIQNGGGAGGVKAADLPKNGLTPPRLLRNTIRRSECLRFRAQKFTPPENLLLGPFWGRLGCRDGPSRPPLKD